MLVLPFIGLFLSLTLWGTLFPVPRASGPPESFMERLSGAMKVTALVKGAHGLMEMFSMYRTLPRHKDPVRYVQDVAFWADVAELAYLPNRTETGLSEVIPLWVETIVEEPVVDNGSSMFPSLGHVVAIERAGFDPIVSVSPASSRAVVWAVAWIVLAVLFSLWLALVPTDAYTLENALEALDRFFEPSPKAACRLGADCGPSVYDEVVALVGESGCLFYLDSLLSPSTDSSGSELPLEEEVGDVWIHREVETAITRLERQRAIGVTSELETCITQRWTVRPDGAVEPSMKPVPAESSVTAQFSCHLHWSHGALVPRRPENLAHELLLCLLWTLITRWPQVSEESDTGTGDSAEPHRGHRRISQKKRHRHGRRTRPRQEG
jgi:hypothetical protein